MGCDVVVPDKEHRRRGELPILAALTPWEVMAADSDPTPASPGETGWASPEVRTARAWERVLTLFELELDAAASASLSLN